MRRATPRSSLGPGPASGNGYGLFGPAGHGFAPSSRISLDLAARLPSSGIAASLSSGNAYVFQHHTQRATGRFRGRVFARADSRRSICHPGSEGSARKRPSSRRPQRPLQHRSHHKLINPPPGAGRGGNRPRQASRRRGSRGGRGRKKPGTAAGATATVEKTDEKPELKPQPAKRERKAAERSQRQERRANQQGQRRRTRRSAHRCRRPSASC